MMLFDVNLLVYAHRQDAPRHPEYRAWLERTIAGDEAYGIADLVAAGFLRIVTHARVFTPPSPLDRAFTFLTEVREQPNALVMNPGERHWDIFVALCRDTNARGNLVPDAYLAALAIESGSEWITSDGDFARFPGLRWRHPLA